MARAHRPRASGAPRRLAGLQDQIASPSWEERYLASKRLGTVEGAFRRSALSILARAATDTHRSVRCQVAISLGDLGLAGAVRALVVLLADGDPWVRVRAAQALGRLRQPSGIRACVDRLAVDDDVRVRATLVKAIGSSGDERYLDIVKAYLSDPDSRVRANTIEGLAGLAASRDRIVPTIAPCLDDPSHRVKANAARLLASFDRPRAMATFDAMLASEDPTVRSSAAFALGELGSPDALGRILPLLTDPSWMVRRNAVDALVKFGPKGVPHLIERLASAHPMVRAGAVAVLGKVGDRAAYSRLLDVVDDPDGEVRQRCEQALSELEEHLGILR